MEVPPPSAPFPLSPSQSSSTNKEQELLLQFFARHEISPDYQAESLRLRGCDIVLVIDDSGSMDAVLDPQPGKVPHTRWQEAQQIARIVVEGGSLLARNVSVRFLNRREHDLQHVERADQLEAAFSQVPTGFTPIVATLEKIFAQPTDRRRVVFLVTDGENTNDHHKPDAAAFYQLLKRGRSGNDHVTILACTDDAEEMRYLENWHCELPRLAVVDDFSTVRANVRHTNPSAQFSHGDYVVQALIGSFQREREQNHQDSDAKELQHHSEDPQYHSNELQLFRLNHDAVLADIETKHPGIFDGAEPTPAETKELLALWRSP